MDLGDLDKQIAGIAKLAEVGLWAIGATVVCGVIAGVVGFIALAAWIWNHVSVTFN